VDELLQPQCNENLNIIIAILWVMYRRHDKNWCKIVNWNWKTAHTYNWYTSTCTRTIVDECTPWGLHTTWPMVICYRQCQAFGFRRIQLEN